MVSKAITAVEVDSPLESPRWRARLHEIASRCQRAAVKVMEVTLSGENSVAVSHMATDEFRAVAAELRDLARE